MLMKTKKVADFNAVTLLGGGWCWKYSRWGLMFPFDAGLEVCK